MNNQERQYSFVPFAPTTAGPPHRWRRPLTHYSSDGQGFVWDSDKAASNASQHGVRFEQAREREVFFDQLACYEDASPQSEARQACIGLMIDYRLLYVVHVIREGDVLRLISARLAEPAERRFYEND